MKDAWSEENDKTELSSSMGVTVVKDHHLGLLVGISRDSFLILIITTLVSESFFWLGMIFVIRQSLTLRYLGWVDATSRPRSNHGIYSISGRGR